MFSFFLISGILLHIIVGSILSLEFLPNHDLTLQLKSFLLLALSDKKVSCVQPFFLRRRISGYTF